MTSASATPTPVVSRKLMGTTTLAFMVVAMASPIGVVVGTAPLIIGLGNGVGAPGAFLLVGVVLIVFAFGFAAIAKALPSAGGFFGFIRAGLGPRAGLAAGFVAGTGYATISVFVAALLAYYCNSFFAAQLGVNVDWFVWAAVLVAAVAALAYFGVKESARVTFALLIIEFVMLSILGIAVLFQRGPAAFPLASFSPTEVFSGSPGFALALAFLCFVGFEVTAVFTRHVRDPEKTIGRATMAGIVILVVVFSLGTWATIAGLGTQRVLEIAQGPDVGQLVPIVASATVGDWMGFLFNVFIITSLIATLIAVFNTTAQYWHRLAGELAPTGFLARSQPKHGSPANAGMALAILICAVLLLCRIAGLDPLVQVAALLGNLGAVAVFGLEIACAIAIFVYFRRIGDRRVWTTTLSPVIAALSLTVFLVLVLSNYPSLIGNSSPVAVGSPLLFVVVAAAGWILGGREGLSNGDAAQAGSAGAGDATSAPR